MAVAGVFLYTSIVQQVSDDSSSADDVQLSNRFRPPVAAIALEQTVQVEVEEEIHLEEKKSSKYHEDSLERNWSKGHALL